MKRGTPTHPKTLDLKDRLSTSLPCVVGILEMLWHMTSQYAPAGDIGRFTNSAIARGVGWDEQNDSDKLIKALVEARFLDENQEHRLVVHDWCDHAEDSIHMRLGRARLLFACGTVPNLQRIPEKERTPIVEAYQQILKERTESHGIARNRTSLTIVAQKGTALAVALAVAKPLPDLNNSSSTGVDASMSSETSKCKNANSAPLANSQRDADVQTATDHAVSLAGSNGSTRDVGHANSVSKITSEKSSSQPASKLSSHRQAEAIYAEYPRKVGKEDALKAIGRVIVSKKKTFDELLAVTKIFAQSKIGRGVGVHDAWHPATFFNQGHYDDDQAEWDREEHQRNGTPPPYKSKASTLPTVDELEAAGMLGGPARPPPEGFDRIGHYGEVPT